MENVEISMLSIFEPSGLDYEPESALEHPSMPEILPTARQSIYHKSDDYLRDLDKAIRENLKKRRMQRKGIAAL